MTVKLKEVYRDMGIENTKALGFGSERASVTMGKRGGIVAKLKEENPYLIGIH